MATYRTVENEGCRLSYRYMSKGPLLIIIPGGGGIGRTYDPILDHLAHKYTACTLDRRQSGGTILIEGVTRDLNPSQQVRDLIAVLKDMAFSKTSLFGNSGGGIIALYFAATHPEYLESVVSHEAPTSVLLPDAESVRDKLFDILQKAKTEGPAEAFKDFRAMQKGFENFPARVRGSAADVDNFVTHEFTAFTLFCPDLRRIAQNKVAVAVGAGARSVDAWYARAAKE